MQVISVSRTTVTVVSAVVAFFATFMAAPPASAVINVPCDPAQLVTAIQTANNTSGGETLNLAAACTYTLTAHFGSTTNGLPAITNAVIIQGNGATIARSAPSDTFRIFEVTTGGDLTLNRVTVRGGHAAGASPSGDGGGIYAGGGAVTLVNATVDGNTADQQGGGIWTDSSLSTSSGTRVTGNSAASAGGGILSIGTLNMSTGSTVDGNSALFGGGIANNGTATLNSSTVSGNNATGTNSSGGGIMNFNSVTLNSSRVFGNSATGTDAQGGGITNSAGTLNINTTTIFSNSATTAPGGVFNNAGTVSTSSSTITGNQPTNCTPTPFTGCTN